MASAIQNLLDELSWEGRSTSYRGGGAGKENVLTAEVWQALDALPRTAFLGAVLAHAHQVQLGSDVAPRPVSAECARHLECEVLCGNRTAAVAEIRVQPDVLLESEEAVVLVEAKRATGGSFQTEQIARNVLVLDEMRGSRAGLLLLVLGAPPPVRVKALGVMAIDEALRAGWENIRSRDAGVPAGRDFGVQIAWITWAEISEVVSEAGAAFSNVDEDVVDAVHRSVRQLVSAVEFHS